MEQSEKNEMLYLIPSPAFSVRDGRVLDVNQPARQRQIQVGADIQDWIVSGAEEYAAFSGGCLFLTLSVDGQRCEASVSLVDDLHVFVLELDSDHTELRTMALVAKELRIPLSNVLNTVDQLFPLVPDGEDQVTGDHIAKLNRGLFQMLRVISNMSDAARYQETEPTLETVEFGSLFGELFEKAATLIGYTGIAMEYRGLSQPACGLADTEKLERAVYNMLSNALKFTPKGGNIQARLTQRGSKLYLTVQDSGEGIPSPLLRSLYSRFQREPAVEDVRFGIGLGMVLIRSAAAAHGGSVLVDQPGDCGTRLTMTLELRRQKENTLRSPVLRIDYAGDQDHALVELSDALPKELYRDARRK